MIILREGKIRDSIFKDVSCISHFHYHIEIIFVMNGEIFLIRDSRKYLLKAGKFAVIMPTERHGYKTESTSEIYILEISPKEIPEYNSLLKNKCFSKFIGSISPETQKNIRQKMNGKALNPFEKKDIIYKTFSLLYNELSLTNTKYEGGSIFSDALNYITDNYHEKISLTSTAKAIGVTHEHLSRVFTKNFGISFCETLENLRLEEAEYLLRTTDLSIAEIAFEAGFGSIRSFNRIFKKYFNLTPMLLRKEMSLNEECKSLPKGLYLSFYRK